VVLVQRQDNGKQIWDQILP